VEPQLLDNSSQSLAKKNMKWVEIYGIFLLFLIFASLGNSLFRIVWTVVFE